MVEGQEAQDTWTSTSCRSELKRGMPKRRKELLPCSQLCHQGKHQWMTAIATVWPDSSWGFPESCAPDDSESKHSSSGSLSREVYLDNANHFAAVFFRKAQGSSPPPALLFLTHAPWAIKNSIGLLVYSTYEILEFVHPHFWEKPVNYAL